MLALIFPQLWQTVSSNFLILVKKPRKSQTNRTCGFGAEDERTDMENGCCKLDMSEVTGTLFLAFFASFAVPLPVNST